MTAAPPTTSSLALTAGEVVADPYPFFAVERGRGAVQWHDGLGMWVTFTHAAANAVLRARTLGRIWTPRWPDVAMPAFALIHVNSLLENEPPAHTRMRRLVAGAFARGHVERLRERIAVLADRLADDVADAGSGGSPVDLVATYAEPLPVQVIAELLGVPEADWHLLRPWSGDIVKMYELNPSIASQEDAVRACVEFSAYLRELARARRARPGDDLISGLVHVIEEGEQLSEDELVGTLGE